MLKIIIKNKNAQVNLKNINSNTNYAVQRSEIYY